MDQAVFLEHSSTRFSRTLLELSLINSLFRNEILRKYFKGILFVILRLKTKKYKKDLYTKMSDNWEDLLNSDVVELKKIDDIKFGDEDKENEEKKVKNTEENPTQNESPPKVFKYF